MRFLRLDLKAVGPFTGVSLDLSGGDPGLHLIVGPNEAGKSSALRAISYLLFDFPVQAPEAKFVHEYPQLRVGGVLRNSRGEVLEVVRRKRNQASLVSADESSPIPEARLQDWLGRIDRRTFENLLGIDHARLRKGGEEIRKGSGDFAGLLFAAAAGLAGLRTAREQLQKQQEVLYKDRGQVPKINAALKALDQAEKDFKQRILHADDWREHDKKFQEASQDREQLAGQIAAVQRELSRNQRLRDAIPVHARRRRIAEELEALGDSPRLRADFGEEVREAIAERDRAGLDIGRSQGQLQQLSERLGGLPDPSAWLAEADSIGAIQKELGSVEKAGRDRVRIDGFRQEDEHGVRGLLRELGQPADLAGADALPLRSDEPAAIRALAKDRADLNARADEARKTIRRQERAIAQIDSERIDEPADVGPIRRVIRLARKAGDLDASWADASQKRKAADREAARALAPIPGWSDDAEKLRDLPIPLDAAIAEFEAVFQRLDRDRQALRKDRERIEADRRQIEADLQALRLNQDVPTEADLAEARSQRDRGWQAIRQGWIDGGSAGPNRRQEADQLDRAIHQADALADRLRREADGVARKSVALARLAQLDDAQSAWDRRSEQHEQEAGETANRWDAVAAGIGQAGSSTAIVREWLKLRDRAIQTLDRSEEARSRSDAIDADRRHWIAAVREAIGPIDPAFLGPDRSLADLLDHAETIVDQADRLAQQRQKLENGRQAAQAELSAAQTTLQAAEDGLARIQADWGGWMERIRLEPSAGPEQAEVFLSKLDQVRETLGKLRDHRRRLEGIDRDALQFASHVRDLADRLIPNRDDIPPKGLARELARRLDEAREQNQERATLTEQGVQEAGRLDQARSRLASAEAHLRRLADEAGSADPSTLLEIERLSVQRTGLERQMAEYDGQLLDYSAGRNLDDFRKDLESADLDLLACRIDELGQDLRELQEKLERVNQTIGAETAELARMKGGDDGAVAAEKIQDLLARVRDDSERFATLRLAEAVLKRGIERYRSQNQGPVLGRAGDLFRTLTDGSFASLRIEDDDGQAVLQGVRSDGRAVGVDGMSDGTHDQLYLALRLAVLESWLEDHEPVPFVVDDILLTFDDQRAAAALRALADFSSRTQVLMFTHHEHLVDLARQAVPADRLTVRELPRTASLANASSDG